MNKHFVLGSGSKRRLELLSQIGVKPDLVLSPNINEEALPKQFLLVGSEDNLTTPKLVQDYKEKLELQGQPVDFWIYEGRGHAFLDSGTNYFLGNSFEEDAPEALDKIIEFLDRVFI